MQTLSVEDRLEFTRLIMALLDSWRIRAADQITLLGLPEKTKPRAMKRYHEDTPLPDEQEINERLEHLVGISDALRTTFPRNGEMPGFWMHKKNDRFEDRKPLDVMLQDGLEGIVRIRAHLDCAWDWHQDSQNQ